MNYQQITDKQILNYIEANINPNLWHYLNNDMIVSGSYLNKLLLQNPNFKSYDIDIFLTKEKFKQLIKDFNLKIMRQYGWCQNTIQNIKEIYNVDNNQYSTYLNRNSSNFELRNMQIGSYSYSKQIINKFTFYNKQDKKYYDFIVCHDPIKLISETYLDICKNYYNGTQLFVSNLKKVLNIHTKIDIECNIHNYNQRRIINKYKFKGYKYNIKWVKENTNKVNSNEEDFIVVDNHISDFNKYIERYNKMGLVVLPLNNNDPEMAGKSPNIKNWNHKTINDENYIPEHTTNIGLLCGKNSNIIVIDVDEKDDGVLIWNKLKEKYNIPLTAIQSTPNNGFHYFFKYNPRIDKYLNAIKFPIYKNHNIGLDLRSNGSQVVAYPSYNQQSGGQYTWIVPLEHFMKDDQLDLPELPEWLYNLLENKYLDDDFNIIHKSTLKVNMNDKEDINQTIKMLIEKLKDL